MTAETYPCYIKIRRTAEDNRLVEIPAQLDGSVLLSTVNSQFPKAIGLRFKSDTGAWRGISLDENKVMIPPENGWGSTEYCVVRPKAIKRKTAIRSGPLEKLSKMTDEEILTDLIMLGLPYAASEADIKKYFSAFGELELFELKYDSENKSRGFGFIRFKTVEAVRAVMSQQHVLHDRTFEVRFPKEDAKEDTVPTKVFIGRLPRDITVQELRDHFSDYGDIKDVYIPEPFRGFGFVTFTCQSAAEEVMSRTHVIKETYVNVSNPSTKKDKLERQKNTNNNNTNNTNNDRLDNEGNRFGGNKSLGLNSNMSHNLMQQSLPFVGYGIGFAGNSGGGYSDGYGGSYGGSYGGGYFNQSNNWEPRKPSGGNYGAWGKP